MSDMESKRHRHSAFALLLLCAGLIVVVKQHRGNGLLALEEEPTTPVLQELASALKSPARISQVRSDLARLEQDLDAADKQLQTAPKDTEGLGMHPARSSARDAQSLLSRHTTAYALRRLDHATSKLLGKWLGEKRKGDTSKQQQLRDEIAFGEHTYKHVTQHGEHRSEDASDDVEKGERGSWRESERERERGATDRRESKRRWRNDEHDDRRWWSQEGRRGDENAERRGWEERRRHRQEEERERPRQVRKREVMRILEAAERKEQARVQSFVTRKAEALQRLFRKQQLELKYQAEYLKESQVKEEKSTPSAAAADDDDTYRRRQKQMMESAIAHAQKGHASGSVEAAGRAAGGVYRRRVKRIESSAERHTWDAATERDIARVHARLISHDAAQREWYGDSSPLTKLSEAQEERQGNGLRDLQASSLSSPVVSTSALAPTPPSVGIDWPVAPRRHPQGAYDDSTVYDKDYSWPSTKEVVEGDEWQRKGDCGAFGSNC